MYADEDACRPPLRPKGLHARPSRPAYARARMNMSASAGARMNMRARTCARTEARAHGAQPFTNAQSKHSHTYKPVHAHAFARTHARMFVHTHTSAQKPKAYQQLREDTRSLRTRKRTRAPANQLTYRQNFPTYISERWG
eukprot:6189923-Pleurochrysis_carterae.AAC.3